MQLHGFATPAENLKGKTYVRKDWKYLYIEQERSERDMLTAKFDREVGERRQTYKQMYLVRKWGKPENEEEETTARSDHLIHFLKAFKLRILPTHFQVFTHLARFCQVRTHHLRF